MFFLINGFLETGHLREIMTDFHRQIGRAPRTFQKAFITILPVCFLCVHVASNLLQQLLFFFERNMPTDRGHILTSREVVLGFIMINSLPLTLTTRFSYVYRTPWDHSIQIMGKFVIKEVFFFYIHPVVVELYSIRELFLTHLQCISPTPFAVVFINSLEKRLTFQSNNWFTVFSS